ncbi:histidinol-phosphatase [Otoolea muris]|uniref:histidinol-phosphatase n=1 Tax=Otoolea muris TaxID=2941515 RepID=UPI00203F2176|nr:histidinol-phosphatase [Otoolea muris]
MLRADFHTHTTFCDGRNTPKEMAEAAYQKGFTDFGISGHADFSFCDPGFGMGDSAFEEYKRELYRLREAYAGRMNLYIGVELDCLGPRQEADYAIGSTHCVLKNGEYVCVDDTEERLSEAVMRLWGGDWYAFVRDYFETEARVFEKTGCDWIGHFDLLTKFNRGGRYFDENSDDFLEPALAAMKRLNREGLPFEINTGAISRGYRDEPYPSGILLRELNLMGGRILINSDSHSRETIGYGFDKALQAAWESGFRQILVLTPGGSFRELNILDLGRA